MTNERDLQNIKVPLDDFVREVAREAAREVIKDHAKNCKVHDLETTVEHLQGKVDKLTWRLAILIGAMLGSGLIGGAISALLAG